MTTRKELESKFEEAHADAIDAVQAALPHVSFEIAAELVTSLATFVITSFEVNSYTGE
jgi:hypothetical protein